MPFHSTLTGDQIHTPIAFEYADEDLRTSDTSLLSTDLYKFARQTDDDSIWMLVSTTPTWQQVGLGSGDIDVDNLYTVDGTISGLPRNVAINNEATLGFNAYDDTSSDYTTGSTVSITSVSASIGARTGDGAGSQNALSTISVNATLGMRAIDGILSRGIIYGADYSANYTTRSLVDKGYVDGATFYGTNGTISENRTVTVDGNYRLLFLVDNSDVGGYVDIFATGFEIGHDNNGSVTTIDYSNAETGAGITVTDGIGSVGMTYASDYSDNFVDRSLVDKAYVDANGGIYGGSGELSGATLVEGFDTASLQFYHYNTSDDLFTARGILGLNNAGMTLQVDVGDGSGAATSSQVISITNSQGMVITDGTNSRGLVYAADYQLAYTARSLVDRGYVDGKVLEESDILIDAETRTIEMLNSSTFTIETYDLTSSDYGERGIFTIDPTTAGLEVTSGDDAGNAVNSVGIVVDLANSIIVTDSENGVGMEYAANYASSNFFNERWIPDKEYVDAVGIYAGDGQLSGDRTLDIDGNTLTFTDTDAGTEASGDLTFSGVPEQDETITIDGVVITYVDIVNSSNNRNEIAVQGLTNTDTAQIASRTADLINAAEGTTNSLFNKETDVPVVAGISGSVVNVFAAEVGEAGNSITTVSDNTDATWSGATLTGGIDNLLMFWSTANVTVHQPLTLQEGTELAGAADSNDRWIVDINSNDELSFSFYDDSATTTSEQLTVGSTGGNMTVKQNLVVGVTGGQQIRLSTGSTADDQWRWDGGNSDDVLRIQYYDDSANTSTNLFTIDPDDSTLNYVSDQSANYTNRSVVDKGYVDGSREFYQWFFGEENNQLSSGYNFSYGNGATGQHNGLPILVPTGYSAEIWGLSFASQDANDTDVTLDVAINGTLQGINWQGGPTSNLVSDNVELGTKPALTTGDKLNMYCVSVENGANTSNIMGVVVRFYA